MKTILLTGANGFVATHVARTLLSTEDVNVSALVRANTKQNAYARLARAWWDYPELVEALGARIDAVPGDVRRSNLGLNASDYYRLAEKTTHIIHTVADWRLLPIEELRKTNVDGTANVIAFAREAKDHLERLSHVSTAYVAGARTGTIRENELTDKFGFFTDYERSKYEAEQLVQASTDELPISVFRPSMVVGDSTTGGIKTFNTYYFPLRLYLTGKLRFMPVSRLLKINLIPVDYVANALAALTFDARAEGLTFHIVAPRESLPTLGELLQFTQEWARTVLRCNLPTPVYLPMSRSLRKLLLKLQRVTGDARVADSLIALEPYFSENRRFSRDNADRLLGTYDMNWRDFVPHLLSYAVYNSFFHRSDRTVHEQALFRLASKSRPITYYDIIDGKAVQKTAAEMRDDIVAATGALRAFGIIPGDRVALTGLNSTRYVAVDFAIGLSGAVSVPLYYTTPPSDINEVLKASGAKLFFVGIPSLLSRVDELAPDVPVISICRTLSAPEARKNVASWEEFLSKGKGGATPITAPVGFGDIATLRYSSGTTGTPKGSVFRHAGLRYMAESIVSVLPWQARNRRSSYLSFLPMGHVVEGILATYSPYYIPAPVDIYFLEDFKKLEEELPRVRPTVFFSVPRIYEKVWEAMERNALGRLYVKTSSLLLKRTLQAPLKNMTLRRAGLNRCAQLVVGSARSSEELLKNYRALGVEIHNAYGMTEAPLATMNRSGRNRLGTVGEPMPMTEIKIAEGSEIMVKGPQVTAGYFDPSLASPLKDGWLMTGDTGTLTDEGSLVVFGRKKELIKTSYGKLIYSGKIESMCKEIRGISEAMLLGESKPYCAALVWVDKEQWNETALSAIDRAIEGLNARLSNPEKIKRWALLVNNLSTDAGDLTPNLKLKRNVAVEKHASIVDALYSGVIPEGDVHMGGVEQTR